MPMAPIGSSPRARGTRRPAGRTDRALRFIPAGAGNAHHQTSLVRAWSVHPRGRGERGTESVTRNALVGSSPRARGTLAYPDIDLRAERFIPAGAGNAGSLARAAYSATVHPRGRGERRSIRPGFPAPCRFIPAGAGNARTTGISTRTAAVHPRGRGERAQRLGQLLPILGSSPRARGTQCRVAADIEANRFIPAGAGNALRASACIRCTLTMSNSVPEFLLRSFRAGQGCGGRKDTSRKPSRSTGTRRF